MSSFDGSERFVSESSFAMTTFTKSLPDFLVTDASGFIRIAGHRIGYHHVVALFNEGYSAESLWEEFLTLPLATIYKVIAFHLENQPASNEYVEQCHEEVRQQAANAPTTPDLAELRRWLARRTIGVGDADTTDLFELSC